MRVRPTLTMLLAIAATALAAPAMAQDGVEVPQIAAEDVSVGQIVSFVNALIAVERVRGAYMAKIEAADSEDARKALIEQADVAGRAAVDKVVGITPEEYMAIAQAAQQSEDLVGRIDARFAQLRQKQRGLGAQAAQADQPADQPTDQPAD